MNIFLANENPLEDTDNPINLYIQTNDKLMTKSPYFTANSLARVITRMAAEQFRRTGLSPSHAFLMMLVNDYPGIGQKELYERLHPAPSTITRFMDALVYIRYSRYPVPAFGAGGGHLPGCGKDA